MIRNGKRMRTKYVKSFRMLRLETGAQWDMLLADALLLIEPPVVPQPEAPPPEVSLPDASTDEISLVHSVLHCDNTYSQQPTQ